MALPTPTSVMLVSGEYFDHLAPDPAVLDLDVLEHGLAAPRFNNQTLRPISIAEHSLRVRRIVRELGSVCRCSDCSTDRSVEICGGRVVADDAYVPGGTRCSGCNTYVCQDRRDD